MFGLCLSNLSVSKNMTYFSGENDFDDSCTENFDSKRFWLSAVHFAALFTADLMVCNCCNELASSGMLSSGKECSVRKNSSNSPKNVTSLPCCEGKGDETLFFRTDDLSLQNINKTKETIFNCDK